MISTTQVLAIGLLLVVLLVAAWLSNHLGGDDE